MPWPDRDVIGQIAAGVSLRATSRGCAAGAAPALMIRFIVLMTLMVRHEALFDRTGVKGPRCLAVAAAGLKLEEA